MEKRISFVSRSEDMTMEGGSLPFRIGSLSEISEDCKLHSKTIVLSPLSNMTHIVWRLNTSDTATEPNDTTYEETCAVLNDECCFYFGTNPNTRGAVRFFRAFLCGARSSSWFSGTHPWARG